MGLVIGHRDQHLHIKSLFVYRIHCPKLALLCNFCRFKFLHWQVFLKNCTFDAKCCRSSCKRRLRKEMSRHDRENWRQQSLMEHKMNFLCQGQHLATRKICKYFKATEFGTFRALLYYEKKIALPNYTKYFNQLVNTEWRQKWRQSRILMKKNKESDAVVMLASILIFKRFKNFQ